MSDTNNLNRSTPLESFNIVSSTLSVQCSGTELNDQIQQDLELPIGKSIAELLYEQKEKEQKQE